MANWECARIFIGAFGQKKIKRVNTIHMYSGITSGRVLDGELLYTKILDINLFAFAYRLFMKISQQSVGKCKQMNF